MRHGLKVDEKFLPLVTGVILQVGTSLIGDALMTDDERYRLNIALLFLELIIDSSEDPETSVIDLAWAAHSYLQSVTLEATLPDEEARQMFSKLQVMSAIVNAKRRQDRT